MIMNIVDYQRNVPMKEARQGLLSYFTFYNQTRFHQNLDYQTPDMVYYGQPEVKLAA